MKIKHCFAAVVTAALMISCGNNAAMESTGSRSSESTSEAVLENIMTRSSVRDFTGQTVSKDTLDILIKAGMAAPTAINKQPWAFVAINDRQILDSLMNVHPYSNLEKAGAAIVVCGDMQRTIEGPMGVFWVQDCSAATENILLAAHALKLGAVWCGVYPRPELIPEVSRVLSLPDYIVPLNIITIGYPSGKQKPKDKWKPEYIHYQKW